MVLPAHSQGNRFWNTADNPVAGATNLGDSLIGINCVLPPGGVINNADLQWSQDNGK
jgi:hypothetical protein